MISCIELTTIRRCDKFQNTVDQRPASASACDFHSGTSVSFIPVRSRLLEH